MGRKADILKLGKGQAFDKARLKRLRQPDETWEADFRALPKRRMQNETHFFARVWAAGEGFSATTWPTMDGFQPVAGPEGVGVEGIVAPATAVCGRGSSKGWAGGRWIPDAAFGAAGPSRGRVASSLSWRCPGPGRSR
jgi:hypothetical protein